MNENRNILDHLEELVGSPMNLLIYIECVVENNIFQSVYSFHEMSDTEISELEALALPGSITESFCKSLRSIKGGGTLNDFLQKDIDDLSDADDDLCDDDETSEAKIEVYGMTLPNVSDKNKMLGVEVNGGDYFYKYKDGSVLLVRPFVCTSEIASEVILESVRESIKNMALIDIATLCKLYQKVTTTVRQLSSAGDIREFDYAEVSDLLLTQIEMKANIPYKDD